MVLGAKKNRASIVLHDATLSTCDIAGQGLMSVVVDIENFSDFGNHVEIVNTRSRAKLTFTKN